MFKDQDEDMKLHNCFDLSEPGEPVPVVCLKLAKYARV